MRTAETIIGRVSAVLAVTFGVVYLGWRGSSTLSDVPWWLGVPTLAVEAAGVFAVSVTCWAVWRRPDAAAPLPAAASAGPAGVDGRRAVPEPLDTEIVVRCTGQTPAALRATLIACRPIAPLLVVDVDARPEIAALAVEHGARYLATDPDDIDGLALAASSTSAGAMFLLEAGDVAHPSVLRSLLPWFDEPSVAVVQGPVEASNGESAEHGAIGRHDKQFERRSLVPSLGARGLAPFTGTGALLRTGAIRSVSLVQSSPQMVQADLTSSLFAAGWQIAAPGGRPLVAAAPIVSPAEVEDVRAREASAARHLLLGDHGAWRLNQLSFGQRASLTAQAVRPLAGVRRGVIVALLLGALLAGRLPFDAEPLGFAVLWAPWFVLAAVSLWLLSGGELRPGDRVRWSMRMLGASWRGVVALDGRPDPAEHVLGNAFGLHHGVASAGAVAAISVVIGMRALSDRVTHTLAAMPTDQTAALLVAALWSLGGGLDALRILARRAQSRRATRIASSLPSTFADRAALVVDLTPLGAGVLGDVDLAVGSHQQLDVVVPTASGVISAAVPVIVRNVRVDFSGERRYGVEFGALEPYVADALTEYCVVQPALDLLGRLGGFGGFGSIGTAVGSGIDPATAGARPMVVLDDHPVLPRRMGLRAAALVAVAGAMASAVPTAEASAPGGRVQGSVTASTFDGIGVSSNELDGDVEAVAVDEPMVPRSTVEAVVPVAPSPTLDIATTVANVPTIPTGATGATTPTNGVPPGDPGVGGSGIAGTVVVVVCSTDSGADGAWGTSDDTYGGPISTEVAADGTWSLDVDGTACWAAIAPPVGFMVAGETGELESPASPQPVAVGGVGRQLELVPVAAAGTDPTTDAAEGTTGGATEADAVTIDDVVWADLDGDGVVGDDETRVGGVTVTLVDGDGVAIGADVTDDEGRFAFEGRAAVPYQLIVSNLPAGLVAPDVFGRSAEFVLETGTDVNLAIGLLSASPLQAGGGPVTISGDDGPGTTTVRLLAEPTASALAPTPDDGSPFAGWLVVMLATLIGVSVLAGSLRPGRNGFAPSVPRVA
jgi:SdrD B-like domain/Glycosyl transferase family group 2